MPKKQLSVNLEKSLDELEKTVLELEQGELSLEDALKRFERGVGLARACQQALREAEQKVEMLVGDKRVPLPGNEGETFPLSTGSEEDTDALE